MNMFRKLPHFVIINNEKFYIRTDFRIFIDFEKEMQGRDKKEACYNALNKFYPAFLEIVSKNLLDEAINKLLWFYKCGKSDAQINHSNKSNKNLRLYDYDYDSDIIWGAYYEQYRIDLNTVKLHWWKFRAMWNSLKSDCEFSKIRGYRAYTGKDKELLELKEQYKLPPSKFEIDEQKRRNEVFNQLNNMTSQK